MSTTMRICSLLPSATEIIYALGLEENLVAVSHECDYPPSTAAKPHVTSNKLASGLNAGEIDAEVRKQLGEAGTLYSLDTELLESVMPDVVLTQELCTVCAVSYENVRRLVSDFRVPPRVLNLEPTTLADVYETIFEIGILGDVHERAHALVAAMDERLTRLRRLTSGVEPRRMLFLEWFDPPFCAGHWIPELIVAAGGRDELNLPSRPSQQLAWEQIYEYNPEVIVISCCGFPVDRTMMELRAQSDTRLWDLDASRSGNIIVVDGSSYFSRPGPRLVESAEVLATILHPEIFPIDFPGHVATRVHHEFSIVS